MIGGLVWIATWAKKIKESHERRMEQMKSFRKRSRKIPAAGKREARRIKLSGEEKRKLRAKIVEQQERRTKKIA